LSLFFLVAEAFETILTAQILGLGLFLLASLTDIFDGILARRYGAVTRLGRLMDPIADKILVASALIIFVNSPFVKVPAWPVALMIAREFAVTGLRLLAGAEGVTLGAEASGKFKTIIQMVGLHYILIVAIVEHCIRDGMLLALAPYMKDAHFGVYIFVFVMTAATVYSGIDYLIKNYRYLSSEGGPGTPSE